jgi:hypothetical protein
MSFFSKPLATESADSKDETVRQPQEAEKASSTSSVTVQRTPLSKDFRSAVRKNINIGKSSAVERKKVAG